MTSWQRQIVIVSLSCALSIASVQVGSLSALAQSAASTRAAHERRFDAALLDQLVAPVALYPDALVAQIFAASAYPVEVVEAQQWMHEHSDLHGDALAQQVDTHSWDPSVKALTQFPSILDNMSRNLAWISSLGDAYVNQQADLLNAVQVMRRRAQAAGNLRSTPQQIVTTDGQAILIEPADINTVYVPQYDPWLAYGAPLEVYPDYEPVQGLWAAGSEVTFGLGLGIGLLGGVGWGWHHWGADWRDHKVERDHAAYAHHSTVFGIHGASLPQPAIMRGDSAYHGLHTGAFSGVSHGGVARGYSFRGQSSFGGGFRGGSDFRGGGSGFHGGGGGGFHGGGGHR